MMSLGAKLISVSYFYDGNSVVKLKQKQQYPGFSAGVKRRAASVCASWGCGSSCLVLLFPASCLLQSQGRWKNVNISQLGAGGKNPWKFNIVAEHFLFFSISRYSQVTRKEFIVLLHIRCYWNKRLKELRINGQAENLQCLCWGLG